MGMMLRLRCSEAGAAIRLASRRCDRSCDSAPQRRKCAPATRLRVAAIPGTRNKQRFAQPTQVSLWERDPGYISVHRDGTTGTGWESSTHSICAPRVCSSSGELLNECRMRRTLDPRAHGPLRGGGLIQWRHERGLWMSRRSRVNRISSRI